MVRTWPVSDSDRPADPVTWWAMGSKRRVRRGLALALSMGLVFLFGSAGTWAVLRAPAVPYLRSE